MIVVDENLHDRRIMEAISVWYPGSVVSVVTLRPRTIIKDEAIPSLLLKAVQPTFVTINVIDFGKRFSPTVATVSLPLPCPRSVLVRFPVSSVVSSVFLLSRPKYYGWGRLFA